MPGPQLGVHERERFASLRQLRRVGVASPTRVGLERPAPGDDEAARTAPRRRRSLCTGSDSPVRSDSSTSSPAA